MSSNEIDMAALADDQVYKVLVSAVQPRPIAWVSTISGRGVPNLAPFAFYTIASRKPPTVLVSIGHRTTGGEKDTLINIRETGCFVVNTPSMDHLAAVSITSDEVAGDVDEFQLAGLATAPSKVVAAPRIDGCLLSIECTVTQEVEVGDDVVVFGAVRWVHAAKGVFDDGMHVDNDVLRPLGRLAGPWFSGPLSGIRQAVSAQSAPR